MIIVGATGTGKTLSAEVLLDQLKTKVDGGFKVVRVTHGPQQVWAWRDPGPVVFMIEDPWGKYRFHPEQLPWNADLDQMLQGAHKDRRFIVTTRSDVFAEAEAKRLSAKWFVSLETRHYGQKERVRLFETRLRGLPEPVQRAAHPERSLVLERLESPYEIQKFFDGLRDGPRPDETGPELVRRCIQLAHTDAIESTIVEQVTDRGDHLPATAVWGLMKARPLLSWSALSTVALALGDRDSEVEDQIEPLVRFMAAGRNLRQPNDVLSYYHPRVEAGLEKVLRKKPSRSARLLGALLDVLLDLDTREGADWGQESAAQLLEGVRRDGVDIRLSTQAQARIDAYLRRRLLTVGGDIDRDLDLAVTVGTQGDPLFDLARWLSARGKVFGNLDHWRDLRLTKPQMLTIAADPDVPVLAARYLREYLPPTRDRFDATFCRKLTAMADPLTEAYRDAALALLENGRTWNARLVATSALADFDGFEPVLAAAVEEDRKLRLRQDDGVWLEIRNGEHSESYGQYLAEQHYEDGDTAETYFKLYVDALRGLHGWAAIPAHRHRDALILPWIQLLDVEGTTPMAGEMDGLAQVCRGTRWEARFWDLVADHWAPDLAGRLTRRLRDADLPEEVRHAILDVMARHDPTGGRQALSDMIAQDDLFGVLRWMIDLKALGQGYGVTPETLAFIAAAPDHAGPFKALAHLVLAGRVETVATDDLARLEKLDAGMLPDLQLVKAQLMAASGRPVRALVENLLAPSSDEQDDINRAVAALAIAVAQEDWELVDQGLQHRFADVRRDALLATAPREPQPLPQKLLDLAMDRGSRVRLALVGLLKTRPDPTHQPALVTLIHDTWSNEEFYGGDADYPIACRAAELLGDQAPIGAAVADTALQVAANTDDPELRWLLMAALARQAGDHGQDMLTDLAVEVGRPVLHAAAASALYAGGAMGPQRARRFNKAHLLRRPANVAVNMALAVGASGAVEPTLALAKALVADTDRKALVFAMLFSAIGREDDLADRLAPLLPVPLTLALKAMVEGGVPMQRSALDGLGEFRVRDAVLERLSGLFEKKAATPVPSRPVKVE